MGNGLVSTDPFPSYSLFFFFFLEFYIPLYFYISCLFHTKKKSNKVAHNLVKYVLYILDYIVLMEDIPPQFLSIIQADLANFS